MKAMTSEDEEKGKKRHEGKWKMRRSKERVNMIKKEFKERVSSFGFCKAQ